MNVKEFFKKIGGYILAFLGGIITLGTILLHDRRTDDDIGEQIQDTGRTSESMGNTISDIGQGLSEVESGLSDLARTESDIKQTNTDIGEILQQIKKQRID